MSTVAVPKPDSGDVQSMRMEPGTYAFDFGTDALTFSVEDGNLVLTFDDGAILTLQDFFIPALAGQIDILLPDGLLISGQDVLRATFFPFESLMFSTDSGSLLDEKNTFSASITENTKSSQTATPLQSNDFPLPTALPEKFTADAEDFLLPNASAHLASYDAREPLPVSTGYLPPELQKELPFSLATDDTVDTETNIPYLNVNDVATVPPVFSSLQRQLAPDAVDPFAKATDTNVAFPHLEDARGKALIPLAGFFPEMTTGVPLFIEDMLDTSPRAPLAAHEEQSAFESIFLSSSTLIPEEDPAEHPTITQEIQIPLQTDAAELLLTYLRMESM